MKLGIALSGGGIRGIAHAGVLQALEDNGIRPNIIGGTSCGSMVAVMYAMGYSPYHIYILFKRYAKDITKVDNFAVISGLKNCFNYSKVINCFNSGEKIEEVFNRVSKRRGISSIKNIEMPIVIPSVDLKSGKEIVFTNRIPQIKNSQKEYCKDISIGKAIRASSSFPRIFWSITI